MMAWLRSHQHQLAAVVLAVVFAIWLWILEYYMKIQVDARLRNHFAVLPSMGVVVTNFAAVALAPVLLLSAFFLRENAGQQDDTKLTGIFQNLLGILLGCAIGWGLGVFLVPYDDADGAIYSKIGAGITTFLSGFVVAYVPDIVKEQLELRRSPFLVQVGLGAAALLVTGLAVTTNRTEYLEYARLMRADETALKADEKAEIEAVKAKFAKEYERLQTQRLAKQSANADKTQAELDAHAKQSHMQRLRDPLAKDN
jgi:hypothetical protein